MKKNLPVTDQEVTLGGDTVILSTTDAKGIITYVNQDFIDISGFSREELLHKNHNIVRHPDMPPAAFGDLWETIKKGSSWMGIVKNRCKNGDYYWVDAFATPVIHNGTICEYQSVRVKPDPDCVKRAEATYRQINRGERITALKKSLPLQLQVSLLSLASLLPLLALLLMEAPSTMLIVGAALLSAGMAFGGTALLLQPFNKAVKQAKAVVDNPLMRYIYTGRTDEIGQLELSLKMTRSERNAVVGRMTDILENLRQASSCTATIAEQTSQKMNHQKTELTSVVSAMTEMSATVQDVANNTSEAAAAAKEGKAQAIIGQNEVAALMDSLTDMAAETEQVAKAVDQLSESSKSIGSVLDVIKGIAEQTNLLALNAAIEAARAGEQGRGFAVVADEVRTLAVRTQEATQEIRSMIEQLQQEAEQAVEVMNQECSIAQVSVEKGEHTRNTFQAIVDAVTHIDQMNAMIASAADEQNSVTQEISSNLNRVDQVADEVAEGADSAVRVISELVQEMEHTERLVRQFDNKR